MILLDTCSLLWLGNATLPAALRSLVESMDDLVVASAISAWEISLKYRLGKLHLHCPPDEWWPTTIAHHSLGEVPVESEVALLSGALPPLHNDPADRILIATAMHIGATLLTPDPRIHAYPGVKVRWL